MTMQPHAADTAGQHETIHRPAYLLPVIIMCLFCGASIWFSGNAVLTEIAAEWGGDLRTNLRMAGWITNAVQFGFIIGTSSFAVGAVSDRFPARQVFLCCALAGGAANLTTIGAAANPIVFMVLRFCCGFFLAGIYPVGMKIAAGWYGRSLGRAMGMLIGALVLGTAFPHLMRGGLTGISWQTVICLSSALCGSGGILMYLLVGDGPFLVGSSQKAVGRSTAKRKTKEPAQQFSPRQVLAIFSHAPLRRAAFGYFGHMWELYALWAFIPLFIQGYAEQNGLPRGADLNAGLNQGLNLGLWSFLFIGAGAIGCILGGLFAVRLGSATVARIQLAISLCCCLLSWLFFTAPVPLFMLFMLVWGISVAGDSPQFSTLVARSAPPELMGSGLTLVNCIGFVITLLSISLLQWLSGTISLQYLLVVLALGPALGLYGMRNPERSTERSVWEVGRARKKTEKKSQGANR